MQWRDALVQAEPRELPLLRLLPDEGTRLFAQLSRQAV
jgi:hypothetical protein